jgi:acyl-CoA synthetase (AMP-forming)/AMP-acid ligase II
MAASPHFFPGLSPETLIELLRRRALQQPEQRAYTFLLDGETAERHLTYGELDRQARRIAALLQSRCREGERALLLYPPGLDYIAAFFGCLYAGVIAVPAYPPRNDRALPRLQAIIQDAGAALVLSTEALLSKIDSMFKRAPELPVLKSMATDRFIEGEERWRAPAVHPDHLAFLQYTSGSTGTPKGVMLTHRNLLHNEAAIYERFGHADDSIVVSWLPTYHDMGLIGGMLQPLYGGFPCILMAPASFIQRPLRWLQAISRYRATTSGGPNFAYDHCVRNIPPEQKAELDLSCWTLAFNGAEPVRRETIDRFAAAFAPCGFRREAFYPCYGLAEASLIVSGGRKGIVPPAQYLDKSALEQNRVVPASEEAVSFIGCGKTLEDQQIVIADPESARRCAADEVGEIWVKGPSIAKGYWSRLKETEETFRAFLPDTGEGPFLRTGDLGFLKEGVLFVTGRLKDLIVIQGRNHYPQDIERTVEQSAAILRAGCGAAFSIEVGGEERLGVVQEVDFRQTPDEKVLGAIRLAVAREHELEVYAVVLIRAGTLPKTSSGKIQRRLCRSKFLANDLETLAAWHAGAIPGGPVMKTAPELLAGGAV